MKVTLDKRPRDDSDKTRHVQTRQDLYLLNQVDASQQVHAEINKVPVNALLLVLFLLEHEHVVVEELLQLLVGEVDAKLLKAVKLQGLMAEALNKALG